jgi:hypothetical protein
MIRRPSVLLQANGLNITTCVSLDLNSSNNGEAGTFRAVVAIQLSSSSQDMVWLDAAQIDLSISMSLMPDPASGLASAWVPMMSGQVDRVQIDHVSGLVILEGRDYTARLLDLRPQSRYQNQTSSEIVQDLAELTGLQASVDRTQTFVGQYYQIQHTRLSPTKNSRLANAWDLVTELADLEDFDVWVDGKSLNFKAKVIQTSAFTLQADAQKADAAVAFLNLTSSRVLGLDDAITVEVTSWISRQRKAVSATFPSESSKNNRSFKITRPNMLSVDAESLAKSTYGRLRSHERSIVFTAPGDLTLKPRIAFTVSSILQNLAGAYVINRVDREFNLESGFIQRVYASKQM